MLNFSEVEGNVKHFYVICNEESKGKKMKEKGFFTPQKKKRHVKMLNEGETTNLSVKNVRKTSQHTCWHIF